MNTSKVLNIFLAIALIVMIVKMSNKSTDSTTKSSLQNETLKTIRERKSVRKFTNKQLTEGEMDTILKAGMAAPSGHDKRPWHFIVVNEPEKIKALRSKLEWARGLDSSPTAIVVCGDMSKVDSRNPEFWITDTSAATQNILLALESMNLGGVWCTLYPGKGRMAHARKVLGLPAHIMPMCVIPIGHPSGKNKPKDKYDPATIHWNKW